ncbi:hypothetical protein J6S88_01825, partial [bacterium]|nr:hypothetical protein [bacterium]
IKYFSEKEIKGEIVILGFRDETTGTHDLVEKINKLQKKGFKAKEIATILSELYNENKNDVYNTIIKNDVAK